jgi:hypothetical protein
MPEAPPSSKASVHVTMLLNFFEEVNRESFESRRNSRSKAIGPAGPPQTHGKAAPSCQRLWSII